MVWSRAVAIFALSITATISACGGANSNAEPDLPRPASISSQPTSQSVMAGSSTTFAVLADGDNVTYQWQVSLDEGHNWNDLTGATASNYTITAVDTSMDRNQYRVIVTGSTELRLTSSIVTLIVTDVSTPNLTALAGDVIGGPGNLNGTGQAARFFNPESVAVDRLGNAYVADTSMHTIRKISSDGRVTTFAGVSGVEGSSDGTYAEAKFSYPHGLATDTAGNIYVADYGNNTIRKITPAGVVTTLAGTAGVAGHRDGTGTSTYFWSPTSVATDGSGNVYVADRNNNKIRKISPAGIVSTVAGKEGVSNQADGPAAEATFGYPYGVSTDRAGNLYVTDSTTIRKVTRDGVVSTLAGTVSLTGQVDGAGALARFGYVSGITADDAGNVYVADSNNQTIRKITADGVVSTIAGTSEITGSADGIGMAAKFNQPRGLAMDHAGNLYVADQYNHVIRKITPTGMISTLAGASPVTGHSDGQGASASFNEPSGVATDRSGAIFVSDSANQMIRKITPTGMVSTLVTGFPLSKGLATNSLGDLYSTAHGSIYKITNEGSVTRLGGAVGQLDVMNGIATDSDGNIYVIDRQDQKVKQISPEGSVRTLGNGSATFPNSAGLVVDRDGNVFVSDTINCVIRKIFTSGEVIVLAGSVGAPGSADGIGAAARFSSPTALATDSSGNIYVADTGNHTIRKITPVGVVTTVVGIPGKRGFSGGVLPGTIASPQGIAINGTTLYISTNNGVAMVSNLP